MERSPPPPPPMDFITLNICTVLALQSFVSLLCMSVVSVAWSRVTCDIEISRLSSSSSRGDVSQREAVMFGSLAVLLVSLTGLSIVCASRLSRGIAEVARAAEALSDLKECGAPPRSRFREVAALHKALVLLEASVRELRAFAHVDVLREEEREDAEDTTDDEPLVPPSETPSDTGAPKLHCLGSELGATDTIRSTVTTITMSPRSPCTHRRLGKSRKSLSSSTLQSLHARVSVVMLSLQLQGFQRWVARTTQRNLGCIVEGMSEWVERAENLVDVHGGTILSTLLGDGQLTAVWGFRSRCANGIVHAADAALELTVPPLEDPNNSDASPGTCAAITTGHAWTGTLGSGKVRSPVVVGPHREDNAKLLCVAMSLKASVVVARQAGLERYDVVPLDYCFLSSIRSFRGKAHTPDHPVMVYQIMKKAEVTQGKEWMYDFANKEKKLRPIFEAYKQYTRGDVAGAAGTARDILDNPSHRQLHPAARRLQNLLSDTDEHDTETLEVPSISPTAPELPQASPANLDDRNPLSIPLR